MTQESASIKERLEMLSADRAALLELLVRKKPAGAAEPPLRARGEQDPSTHLPASWAQQSLWFIDQLEGGGAAYNIPVVLELRGDLDRFALVLALDRLVQRHEILRAVFINVEGELKLQIAQTRLEVKVSELAGRDVEERAAELQRHKLEEAQERFDLRAGPPIRARLLCVDSGQHVLLITLHHIVSDGWSIGVMMRELAQLYAACRADREATLAPLPVQYSDYAHWQRQWLKGEVLKRQLDYWRASLKGAPAEMELPADRSRPAVQRFQGQRMRVEIDPALSCEIKAFARDHGVTNFVVLLAAWSVVLSRLSGQDDLVIGTPVANRPRPQLEGLIGLFVNALPLRIQLRAQASLTEFLAQVQKVTLAAFDHQDTPFEQVVEALRPERSLNRHPLFQVMFILHAATQAQWSWPGGLTVAAEDSANETSKFDLLLSLEERGEQLAGSVNWDADLFDRRTIERWIACLELILRGMVGGRYRRIDELPILTGSERRQVVDSFNATSAELPQDCLIHELFEAQVRRAPEVAAVVHGSRSLTYAELNARANQLARRLRSKGVGPDRLVGLYFERSLEMVIGLLATLKAGGAYLPLDPNYPPERLKYMLRDSQPRVLLTQQHLLSRLAPAAAEIIVLDDEQNGIGAEAASDLARCQPAVHSNRLAYVIYTSGSTGQPKGVMIEHHNVVGLWQGLEKIYGQSRACQRVAVNASFNFDASVKQFIQLLSGRTLVLIPEEHRWDAAQLLSYLDEQRVEAIDCTPSQLRTWIAAGLLERAQASLRLVLIGGEPIDAELWQRAAGGSLIDFFNVYGPTECTVDATFVRLHVAAAPSIGPPMQNRRVYILDGYRRPQPVGVLGEIYIGGGGVGRGYLQRPQLTSERFLPDPFCATAGARLYKTGDVGRWRADGTIDYASRNDDQVKIRGFRIEVSEIEACLSRDERVKEAVVIAREDAPGDKRLVAYVTQRGPLAATPVQLQSIAKALLPDYMVPSAFVVLEQMPLTPSAKLDRRALPPPESSAYVRSEYQPPQGEVEQTLAGIWMQLLQNDLIGRHDNFFDLGGHSLLAVKALFHINQLLGCALQVHDIYRNPTLQELAARIGGRGVQDQLIELAREAELDAGIIALPGRSRVSEQAILLTGATGFVGRFLLVHLLRSTQATIYCLVRAISQEQGALRLKATLKQWGLWREEFATRIVAISGDLRMPRLGINHATYEQLCRQVESIYHCATSMNHLETYAMAKPANVGSATELLKIATRDRPKLINYVSTLSIFSSHGLTAERVVDEASGIDHEKHFTSDGYVASKWVSEKIFMSAASRGIPCNVFRLGLVWADTEQGRYDELQRVYRIFKSSLMCGYGIDDYRFETPPMPVDHVAHAVVSLAGRHRDGHGIFHIAADGPPIERVFQRCNEIAGAALELIPFYDWLRELKRLHERGQSLPAVPLIQSAFSMSEAEFYELRHHQRRMATRISAERTRAQLERFGAVPAVSSDELLKVCLQGMLRWDAELRELREPPPLACASD